MSAASAEDLLPAPKIEDAIQSSLQTRRLCAGLDSRGKKKASPGGIRRGPDSTPATRDVQRWRVLPGPETILFVHRLSLTLGLGQLAWPCLFLGTEPGLRFRVGKTRPR